MDGCAISGEKEIVSFPTQLKSVISISNVDFYESVKNPSVFPNPIYLNVIEAGVTIRNLNDFSSVVIITNLPVGFDLQFDRVSVNSLAITLVQINTSQPHSVDLSRKINIEFTASLFDYNDDIVANQNFSNINVAFNIIFYPNTLAVFETNYVLAANQIEFFSNNSTNYFFVTGRIETMTSHRSFVNRFILNKNNDSLEYPLIQESPVNDILMANPLLYTGLKVINTGENENFVVLSSTGEYYSLAYSFKNGMWGAISTSGDSNFHSINKMNKLETNNKNRLICFDENAISLVVGELVLTNSVIPAVEFKFLDRLTNIFSYGNDSLKSIKYLEVLSVGKLNLLITLGTNGVIETFDIDTDNGSLNHRQHFLTGFSDITGLTAFRVKERYRLLATYLERGKVGIKFYDIKLSGLIVDNDFQNENVLSFQATVTKLLMIDDYIYLFMNNNNKLVVLLLFFDQDNIKIKSVVTVEDDNSNGLMDIKDIEIIKQNNVYHVFVCSQVENLITHLVFK